MLPLAVWLMRGSQRSWAWSGALAWAFVLVFVPLWGQVRSPVPAASQPVPPLEAAAAASGLDGERARLHGQDLQQRLRRRGRCSWRDPWRTTMGVGGRIRPLFGLYRETSRDGRVLVAETDLRSGSFRESGRSRPHWFDAWQQAGQPSLDTRQSSGLGRPLVRRVRRRRQCCGDRAPRRDGHRRGHRPPPRRAAWHQASVQWWISSIDNPLPSADNTSSFRATPESTAVPVLSPGGGGNTYPIDQARRACHYTPDATRLTCEPRRPDGRGCASPGIPTGAPWGGTPVRKGGPGHLVVWAEQGDTDLRWSVPGAVDAAAAAATCASLLVVMALATVNRRRGFQAEPRPAPARGGRA